MVLLVSLILLLRKKYLIESIRAVVILMFTRWRYNLFFVIFKIAEKSQLHHSKKSLQEANTRILRSDTIANTPIRTLRSRNIDLSTAMKPKNEELKTRSVHSKSCPHRPCSPKSKCIRSTNFPCQSNKKLTKISSFNSSSSSSSSVTTRRSASKRIIK